MKMFSRRISLVEMYYRRRSLSHFAYPQKMSAWQLTKYGLLDGLAFSDEVTMPAIGRPGDVLIAVCAASVNPVDVMMTGGYGSVTLNVWRQLYGTLKSGSEFPLIPGRDFSGIVVDAGCGVDRTKLMVGDEVWGACNTAYPGTHAQYVVVSSNEISRKPKIISHTEAASLPYVAVTSWSAICTIAGFSENSLRGRRVLVLGGSGGIGTFAIQLLKAWGAHITTTCSSDAHDIATELGADVCLDYREINILKHLQGQQRFDLIYDAVGSREVAENANRLLSPFAGSTYVSVVIPFLHNNDVHGIYSGLSKSALQFGSTVLKGLRYGNHMRWALFVPNGRALDMVSKLVDDGKIRPLVERTFPFSQLPLAYAKVAVKHARGKTVVDVVSEQQHAKK